MSLRTRRSLVVLASLMLLTVACTGTTPPGTTTPQSPGATTPAATTPTGTAPATTPAEPTPDQSPGEPTPAGTPSEPSPGDTGLTPPVGGTLRVYCCATDPRSLRPQAASGSDEISILSATQRGLLYYDRDLQLVPQLATAMPEVSADGLTYTFTLGDHNYSDGTPIVAEDFVRAARQLADPRNAFDYGYEACWIEGVDAVLGTDFGCSEGDTPYVEAGNPDSGFDDATIDGLLEQIGVTAPDENTVVFQLKTPTSFWNNIVAMWLFTPVAETQTSWAEAADIKSSGPFMISEWSHNAQIVLTPNPEWNGEPVKVERIEHNIGGDPAAAVAAFERGDLDMVAVPSTEIRRVLADPALSEISDQGPTLSIEYYDFANCPDADTCPPNAAVGDEARIPGGSPTQNVNFRRAMTQAIDLDELIEVGFAGIGQPAWSPTMPGIPEFPTLNADTAPYKFDLAAAAATMQTALDELGIAQPDPATVLPEDCPAGVEIPEGTAPGDIPECVGRARVKLLDPLRFGYNCDAGHDQRVLYLANAWRTNLGFSGTQMDIRCTDFGTFRTERRAGNVYDIARNGWGADFPHPDNQNRDLFACGAGNNNSQYCSDAYDDLLAQGAAAPDYAAAVPFYKQAEELLAQDAPVIFLRYGEGVRLIRPQVTGYIQTANDSQNVGDRFPEFYELSQ